MSLYNLFLATLDSNTCTITVNLIIFYINTAKNVIYWGIYYN